MMSLFKKIARTLVLSNAGLLLIGPVAHVATAAETMTDSPTAPAALSTEPQEWALNGQLTNITQKHADFNAPYSGAQSLLPHGPTEETTDITLMLGKRLWNGAELWATSELDQGFGFGNTLGLAGFSNGGAYKVGENTPYLRFPKLFLRQVIDLSAASSAVAAGPTQLAGIYAANNLTFTIGKFSVTDIFDTNSYAHDPRADFLNWTVIDAGSYDYAADPWGYTWGAALEWTQDWWTLRGGFFQLSPKPNGKLVRINFGENSGNLELEARHDWAGHPGKIKLLAWINEGKMASYNDALLFAEQTNAIPALAPVRRYSSRPGIVLNMEQELSADVGVFARASANRPDKETYEFTDINQSLSAGLMIQGDSWSRHDDGIGMAVVENRLSGPARNYFAAGGMGVLIGDGALNYASEKIMEIFYSLCLVPGTAVSADYQHISNPAYNQDRGPVSIYGLRLHVNF